MMRHHTKRILTSTQQQTFQMKIGPVDYGKNWIRFHVFDLKKEEILVLGDFSAGFLSINAAASSICDLLYPCSFKQSSRSYRVSRKSSCFFRGLSVLANSNRSIFIGPFLFTTLSMAIGGPSVHAGLSHGRIENSMIVKVENDTL